VGPYPAVEPARDAEDEGEDQAEREPEANHGDLGQQGLADGQHATTECSHVPLDERTDATARSSTGRIPGGSSSEQASGARPPAVGGCEGLVLAGVVSAHAQVEVDLAALPLDLIDLIDLALAVVLTAGLEGQQLGVPREGLEGYQHVSHSHASLLCQAAGS
jgi:hypothetical protein